MFLVPNATRQPRPEAGAERTLEGVGWTRLLGAGVGTDMVLSRLLYGPGPSPSIALIPSSAR